MSTIASAWRLARALTECLVCGQVGKGKVVKVTGIENPGRSATVLLRGSNKLVLEVILPAPIRAHAQIVCGVPVLHAHTRTIFKGHIRVCWMAPITGSMDSA